MDFDLSDGVWVSPFVDGPDLQIYIQRAGGILPSDEALAITVSLADAVAAAHRKGVVHRDIKPSNILIDEVKNPHLIDFGICRLVDQATITQGDGLLGSLEWMAPEQIVRPRSEDHRADLHAVGATFYFMLTGVVPFQGCTPEEVLIKICTTMPPTLRQLNPAVPEHLDQVCMRLLAKEW